MYYKKKILHLNTNSNIDIFYLHIVLHKGAFYVPDQDRSPANLFWMQEHWQILDTISEEVDGDVREISCHGVSRDLLSGRCTWSSGLAPLRCSERR